MKLNFYKMDRSLLGFYILSVFILYTLALIFVLKSASAYYWTVLAVAFICIGTIPLMVIAEYLDWKYGKSYKFPYGWGERKEEERLRQSREHHLKVTAKRL